MFKRLKLKKNIKLIVSDFDGVFTDGTAFVDKDLHSIKKISFKDVMGVSQALKNGYKVAIISGEKTPAIDFLAKKFEAMEDFQDIRPKLPVLKQLMEKYSLTQDEVIYIGDDVNDIESLSFVGNAVTVPNANKKVKSLKNVMITKNAGGDGAFREVIDKLLQMK
ncbi:MAG: HAD-IA family hydrolase [Candidatus Gastranaerophilales bacterium]|nr:HAD-IA family hydrolase [Candidatus Gastranaerophilales bacterium]